jgi:hypothetical protein
MKSVVLKTMEAKRLVTAFNKVKMYHNVVETRRKSHLAGPRTLDRRSQSTPNANGQLSG